MNTILARALDRPLTATLHGRALIAAARTLARRLHAPQRLACDDPLALIAALLACAIAGQPADLLRTALIELFEIEPERISMDANLYEDLEIDSIDAIDLIDHVKRKTGYRLVAEDFRSVRTIGDVVAALLRKQQQGN